MSTPTPPPDSENGLPKTSSAAFYGVLLLALVLGGVAFAFGLLPKLGEHARAAEQAKELAIIRVHAITPAPAGEGKPLSLSGELKPLTEAAIVARVTGYVRKWYVDLGDKVAAGQLLAELDTPELEKELSRSKAQLAVTEAALQLSATTARRWKELFAVKAASEQDADEKDADFHLKAAATEAARAEVQRLQEISGFAKITAPFAGTITARKLDIGQLVEMGSNHELFRLAQIDNLRVFVRVPQSFAQSIKAGQSAELLIPELHGQKFQAKVTRTAGSIDAGSRTLLTELEVDNSTGQLLAGSYAKVQIQGAKETHPLTVPANALIFRADGAQLATVNANNKIALKHVVLGKDYGNIVEILEGITSQEKVVPNPPDSLTEGATVEITQ